MTFRTTQGRGSWNWGGRSTASSSTAGSRDPLMVECILVLGELTTLMNHARGEDVRELLAVFDAIAKAAGDEQDRRIGELQSMARNGLFLPADA